MDAAGAGEMDKFFHFLGLERAPMNIEEAMRVILELFSAERKSRRGRKLGVLGSDATLSF